MLPSTHYVKTFVYRTRAIISRSRFEAALKHKAAPFISLKNLGKLHNMHFFPLLETFSSRIPEKKKKKK